MIWVEKELSSGKCEWDAKRDILKFLIFNV